MTYEANPITSSLTYGSLEASAKPESKNYNCLVEVGTAGFLIVGPNRKSHAMRSTEIFEKFLLDEYLL